MKNIKWLKEEVEEQINWYENRMYYAFGGFLYEQYKNKKETLKSVLELINEVSEENKEGLDLNKLREADKGTGVIMTVGTVHLSKGQAEWIEHLRKHSKKCREISELEIIDMARKTTFKEINKLVEESPIHLIHAFRGMYEIKENKDVYRIKLGDKYYFSRFGVNNDNKQEVVVAHIEQNPEQIYDSKDKSCIESLAKIVDGQIERVEHQ